MRSPLRNPFPLAALVTALVALVAPAGALADSASSSGTAAPSAANSLLQLPGSKGCIVDSAVAGKGACGSARALDGPAPFLGSRALALSPDGRNLYVAASESDAIAIFRRDPRSGTLTQARGLAGCVAAQGASGCTPAVGIDGPNSLALSPDGRNVYVTSLKSEALTSFRRDPKTGALAQAADASGCIAGIPLVGCVSGRALVGPDVVTVSPDGANVYVGSFFGNAVAIFNRSASNGALGQPSGSAGCIALAISGCALGIALGAPEGMAISGDGASVYVAAAVSNALVVLSRNPSGGALTQAGDGSGCIAAAPFAGCTTGAELEGANAVAVSPDGDDVYVTSLLSDSVTSFSRAAAGTLTQKSGSAGCAVFLRAAGCSLGRALKAPEGLAVARDGSGLYAAAFVSGALDVFARDRQSGRIAQRPGAAGCLAPRAVPDCRRGRALKGVSSIAVSADSRFVYAAAFGSDAVSIFRRVPAVKRAGTPGGK
jgi:DNA-binding beta-propeller fold protein YncE